jgi:hypothetical protein
MYTHTTLHYTALTHVYTCTPTDPAYSEQQSHRGHRASTLQGIGSALCAHLHTTGVYMYVCVYICVFFYLLY